MGEDVLGTPAPPVSLRDYSPMNTHLKTYTAGEDKSRLQAAAKELGLANARKPRPQVRRAARRSKTIYRVPIFDFYLDSSVEDARMLSVYSRRLSFGDGDLAHTSLPEEFFDAYMTDVQEDEELFDDGHGPVGGDIVSAVLGIIKGMVGPAILYLPHGFASAGYVVAIPALICCTALFLYSSSCLLDAWKLESSKSVANTELESLVKKSRRPLLSYPELAYRALGERGEAMVKTGIALMQSGVCLTYLIFVPQNLHTSCLLLTGVDVSPNIWLALMIAIQIPLSWIRDIRRLTLTNFLANVLILYGLLTCLGFAYREATERQNDVGGPLDELWYNFRNLSPFAKDWFLFIGTAVLLFEGSITLLVPLQEAVVSEEDRERFPKVYMRVILGIISFYTFFGLSCWMAFGDDVRTVLTTSLPPGILATTVQLAYSLAVVFTFPLQNFPSLEIACRTISSALVNNKLARPKSFFTKRNFWSSVLVALLAVVAVLTMESLDKVVSLMGSLLGCPIAFVFPPLIHSYLDTNISTTRLWTNYFVATMGVIAMVLASMITIITWK